MTVSRLLIAFEPNRISCFVVRNRMELEIFVAFDSVTHLALLPTQNPRLSLRLMLFHPCSFFCFSVFSFFYFLAYFQNYSQVLFILWGTR